VIVGPIYLEADDTWHRFYLDAGLLFWEEGSEPNEDDDLLDGECYVDWCSALDVRGVRVSSIKMAESVLTLSFENGAHVVLKHGPRDDATSIVALEGKKSEAKVPH